MLLVCWFALLLSFTWLIPRHGLFVLNPLPASSQPRGGLRCGSTPGFGVRQTECPTDANLACCRNLLSTKGFHSENWTPFQTRDIQIPCEDVFRPKNPPWRCNFSYDPSKKASKSCKPGTSMRFHEISRFLKWLTSPNLIQIVSLILGFLATCGDTCGSCGVSIWSWPLDKRHIHRCWNSASPSWLRIFDFRFSLKFGITVSDFGFPTHHKSPNVYMFLHFSSWCCSMSFTWLVYNQKAGPFSRCSNPGDSVQPRGSLASCHRNANCAPLVALMAGES